LTTAIWPKNRQEIKPIFHLAYYHFGNLKHSGVKLGNYR
jgi:hypothetical protein